MTTLARYGLATIAGWGGLSLALASLALLVGSLGEPPALMVCCAHTLFYQVVVVWPVALAAEWLLLRRLKCPWWLHAPLMPLVFFAISLGGALSIFLALYGLTGEWPASLGPLVKLLAVYAGLDALWGGVFWGTLRGAAALGAKLGLV